MSATTSLSAVLRRLYFLEKKCCATAPQLEEGLSKVLLVVQAIRSCFHGSVEWELLVYDIFNKQAHPIFVACA